MSPRPSAGWCDVGLVPAAVLAPRIDLVGRVDERLTLAQHGASSGTEALTVIGSMLAGGDSTHRAARHAPGDGAEVLRAHSRLQALLFGVALHCLLRWRQPGYDPAVHVGGVQYLLVRGMIGRETPPGAACSTENRLRCW